MVREFQRSLRAGCERGDFRVLHYTLQRDHAHLLVEADSQEALGFAPPPRIDEASSGRWFDGWSFAGEMPREAREVAQPRTWLVCVGWRRHGLVDLDEVPAR